MASRSYPLFPALALVLGMPAAMAVADGAPAAATPSSVAPSAPDVAKLEFRSFDLAAPGQTGVMLPYTLEAPTTWEVRPWANNAFLILGPPDQRPAELGQPQNPWVVVVRPSNKEFPGVEASISNITASAKRATDWRLVAIEARDFSGAKGLLVQMESGDPSRRRQTMIAKVPFASGALDVIASAPVGDFAAFRPLYERILFSLRPAKKE